MRKFLEKFLISLLLATSVLLGLSFWLNVKYGFNIFSSQHWGFLSQLQVSHTPVSHGFYISFIVAFCIFAIGLIAIFSIKHQTQPTRNHITTQQMPTQPVVVQQNNQPVTEQPKNILISKPPRLHLPKNMAQIAAQTHAQQTNLIQPSANNNAVNQTQNYNQYPQTTTQENPYNSVIADIMKNVGYLVKPNPVISGFTPNVFAIGNNEIVWIGGVNCDINTLKTAINKLKSTFEDTLEDITININSFILDTTNTYSEDEDVIIFHDIEELKEFMQNNPADDIDSEEQESFDAYSEYIDTIIKYVKNV